MKATCATRCEKSHRYDIARHETTQLVIKLIKGHEMRQDEAEDSVGAGCGGGGSACEQSSRLWQVISEW